MGKILDRIQKIASNEGITIGALERSIGASKGVLSRAINNGTDIQAKWIEVIVENYPQYSAQWLISGRGEMLADGALPAPSAPQPAAAGQQPAPLISSLLATIREQATEIGRLQERIRQQERDLERLAADAHTSDIAGAG